MKFKTRIATVVTVIMLAFAATLVIAANANASATVPQWSQYFPGKSPKQYVWHDCSLNVGIVLDETPNSSGTPFHGIGGLSIACSGTHRSVSGTAQLMYQPSRLWGTSTWLPASNPASASVPFTTTGLHTGILATPEAGGFGNVYWAVKATVTIAEYGTTTIWSNAYGPLNIPW